MAAPAGQAAQAKATGEGARIFYATDNQGNLVSFSADDPRKLDSSTPITGLGTGVTLRGIDFRPAPESSTEWAATASSIASAR
jgi:hypothetical protein